MRFDVLGKPFAGFDLKLVGIPKIRQGEGTVR